MEFRLTYAGDLRPSGNNSSNADHKQELRKHFHAQLRNLWQQYPHLQEMQHPLPEEVVTTNIPTPARRAEYLANEFQRFGYRFVPLVTRNLTLSCAIHVLFLRREPPGAVVRSGDIDNRLKTIFDALKVPGQESDLGRYNVPESSEDPFFCLAADDALITSVAVETDVLLEPTGAYQRKYDARLVLTVALRPARLTWSNMGFV